MTSGHRSIYAVNKEVDHGQTQVRLVLLQTDYHPALTGKMPETAAAAKASCCAFHPYFEMWGAKLIGAMKRWETDSTLVMYKVQRKKWNAFLKNTGGCLLAMVAILTFLIFIFALLDSLDGVFDGHLGSLDLGTVGYALSGWDGSMTKVEKIPGDEGKLLRLMRDLFGTETFKTQSKDQLFTV
jgi:hypothetical protein